MGKNILTVSATDAAGNSAALTVTVTVDNSAPEKTLISPTDGSVVSGVLLIQAAADDPNLASLGIYVDGALIDASPTSPFSVTVDTRMVLDGPMAITVISAALANNTTSCTATVTVDNQPFALQPQNLNLKAKGGEAPVTVTVEGPDAALLMPTESHAIELRVPGGSPIASTADWAGDDATADQDGDTIKELRIRFDRQALIAAIRAGIAANLIDPGFPVTVTLVASGRMIGTDVVRIVGH